MLPIIAHKALFFIGFAHIYSNEKYSLQLHAHYTGIETLLDPNYKSKKAKISSKICSKENMASVLM